VGIESGKDDDAARARRAARFMVLAAALFAGMNVMARKGAVTLPWQEIAAARFLIGVPMMAVIARRRGHALLVLHQGLAWRRTLFGTVAAGCTFFALAAPDMAVGDAVSLLSLSPLFVALLSGPMLGERLRPGTTFALGLSLSGVLLIVRPSFASALVPSAVALSGALSSGTAMIFLRRVGPEESPEAIVLHFAAFASVAFVALSLPVARLPDAHSASFLLLTGLLGNAAQLAMTRAYALGNAARMSAIGYVGVVFTRLFAVPLFGEIPGPSALLGSLSILLSGAMLARTPARRV
jgi:drug/metabolite transporter (DMT)-like permease